MRLEIPADKKLIHELTMPIAWGDMDALGHVNNAVYFKYMESARVGWLTKLGGALDPTQEGAVIVNTFCNFYKQLTFPGDLRLKLYAANLGRSSFDTFVTIERADEPGVVYAAGGATLVWAQIAEGRSVPLPDAVRALVSN